MRFTRLGPVAKMYPWIKLGPVEVPTYFVLISLSFIICMVWLVQRTKKYQLSPERALDLALVIMLSGFIGARLAHILIEEPGYYWNHPAAIFYFWQGGFVFYGGALGATLSCWCWAQLSQRSVDPRKRFQLQDGWLDLFAPVIGLGYAIGRLGCFFAGCCYGRACELPWAVIFPAGSEAPPNITRHPTQLYAIAGELIIIAVVLLYERINTVRNRVFLIYLLLHACSRIIMEYFRDDDRGPMLGDFSPSTCISIFLICTAILFLIRSDGDSEKTPR